GRGRGRGDDQGSACGAARIHPGAAGFWRAESTHPVAAVFDAGRGADDRLAGGHAPGGGERVRAERVERSSRVGTGGAGRRARGIDAAGVRAAAVLDAGCEWAVGPEDRIAADRRDLVHGGGARRTPAAARGASGPWSGGGSGSLLPRDGRGGIGAGVGGGRVSAGDGGGDRGNTAPPGGARSVSRRRRRRDDPRRGEAGGVGDRGAGRRARDSG